jgi:hypothetical protein
MPGCIIATTAISISIRVTTGKEGGIDPELCPRRRSRRDAGDGAARAAAAPRIVPFVATALAQSRDRYSKSIGEARLMIGNCIRMMARAQVPRRLPLRCGHRASIHA